MPKYRVATYGGMDGLIFPDLLIKYSTGYVYPLRVRQGDCVPTEIFDPLDIQRSLLTGSLGSLIKANAVVVEYSDVEVKQHNKQPRKKKQPQEVLQIPATEEAPKEVPQPQVVEQTSPGKPAHIDFKDVAAPEDFLQLSFFRRLEFIRQCTDKSLLSQLSKKIDSEQLKFQIDRRLEQL